MPATPAQLRNLALGRIKLAQLRKMIGTKEIKRREAMHTDELKEGTRKKRPRGLKTRARTAKVSKSSGKAHLRHLNPLKVTSHRGAVAMPLNAYSVPLPVVAAGTVTNQNNLFQTSSSSSFSSSSSH